jgi:hypothetical protein
MERPGFPLGVGLKLPQFGAILYLVDQAAVKIRGANHDVSMRQALARRTGNILERLETGRGGVSGPAGSVSPGSHEPIRSACRACE